MISFNKWVKNKILLEFHEAHGRELIKLLEKTKWVDYSDEEAEYDRSEKGTKENAVYVIHPEVGEIKLTISRGSKQPPEKVAKAVLKDYKNQVEQFRRLVRGRLVEKFKKEDRSLDEKEIMGYISTFHRIRRGLIKGTLEEKDIKKYTWIKLKKVVDDIVLS